MRFTSHIDIERPAAKVFAFVLHPDNMKHWVQGFRSYRPVKGRKRKSGSRAVQLFQEPDGKTTEVTEEVRKLVPGQLIELQLSHQNMDSEVVYRFLDQGEHTRLQVAVSTRLKPWAFSLLAPFVKGPMRNRQEQDLLRLKQHLEQSV